MNEQDYIDVPYREADSASGDTENTTQPVPQSQYEEEDFPQEPVQTHSKGFATASLITGVLAIVTGCCVFSSILLGAMAIIFALFSKGSRNDLPRTGKAGLWLGIVGVILGFVFLIASVMSLIATYGSLQELMLYYESLL